MCVGVCVGGGGGVGERQLCVCKWAVIKGWCGHATSQLLQVEPHEGVLVTRCMSSLRDPSQTQTQTHTYNHTRVSSRCKGQHAEHAQHHAHRHPGQTHRPCLCCEFQCCEGDVCLLQGYNFKWAPICLRTPHPSVCATPRQSEFRQFRQVATVL